MEPSAQSFTPPPQWSAAGLRDHPDGGTNHNFTGKRKLSPGVGCDCAGVTTCCRAGTRSAWAGALQLPLLSLFHPFTPLRGLSSLCSDPRGRAGGRLELFLSSQMSQLAPHLYPPKPKEGFAVVTNGREGLLHEVSPPGVLRKTDSTQGNTAPQGSNRILSPPSWRLTPISLGVPCTCHGYGASQLENGKEGRRDSTHGGTSA